MSYLHITFLFKVLGRNCIENMLNQDILHRICSLFFSNFYYAPMVYILTLFITNIVSWCILQLS